MLLVSEHVEEMTLRIDWLTTHNCRWIFGENTLYVDDRPLKLMDRKSRIMCRRLDIRRGTYLSDMEKVEFCSQLEDAVH
jgi:hypothetical protein